MRYLEALLVPVAQELKVSLKDTVQRKGCAQLDKCRHVGFHIDFLLQNKYESTVQRFAWRAATRRKDLACSFTELPSEFEVRNLFWCSWTWHSTESGRACFSLSQDSLHLAGMTVCHLRNKVKVHRATHTLQVHTNPMISHS